MFREHEVAGSKPAAETNPITKGALRCGRSSMAEPWVVIPLVSVRLRPVTPERIDSINPLVAEMADATVSEAVAARHARSSRAEGTISSKEKHREETQARPASLLSRSPVSDAKASRRKPA